MASQAELEAEVAALRSVLLGVIGQLIHKDRGFGEILLSAITATADSAAVPDEIHRKAYLSLHHSIEQQLDLFSEVQRS